MADKKNEDIKKAIEDLVDESLKDSGEDVEKSMPNDLEENGGGDKIKSGSPFTEKGEGSKGGGESGAEVAASQKKGDPMSQEEPKEKTGEKHKKKMKKSEEDEGSEEDKVEKSEKDSESSDKLEDMSDVKFEKAQKALGGEDLSEEEIELVKAWREEKQREEEEMAKSQEATPDAEDLQKAISAAVATAMEPLQKKLDEAEKINKSLTEKVEKMASQPAYDKRSISNLETIEKGGSEEEKEISKSQVTDKMLQLQREGKGVRSQHIAEFEATGNISDPAIMKLVRSQF